MRIHLYNKVIAIIACLCLSYLSAEASDGCPYVRNFMSDEYGGHNRNFDIIADDKGNVFVANFEGLMYYDGVEFRVLHTPGISRLTKLLRGSDGRIWFGGYNVFGYVAAGKGGRLSLRTVIAEASDKKIGEVTALSQKKDGVLIETLSGNTFLYDGKNLTLQKTDSTSAVSSGSWGKYNINYSLQLPGNEKIIATEGGGVVCIGGDGQKRFEINRNSGLCSDNVRHLCYNGNGRIWGTTDNGIFCIAYPSAFTHFTEREGLQGEIMAMVDNEGTLYVGTSRGVFMSQGERFRQIEGLDVTCWQLASLNGSVYAATADGLCRIKGSALSRLSAQHTLAVQPMPDGSCIASELKDVCQISPSGVKSTIADIENVTKIFRGGDGTLFLQDVYGKVYRRTVKDTSFSPTEVAKDVVMNLFSGNNGIDAISNKVIYVWDGAKDRFLPADTLDDGFDNPRFIFTDHQMNIWISDNTGKNLTAFYKRKIDKEKTPWLMTMDNEQVSAMYRGGDNVLFGSKSEIISWENNAADPSFKVKPEVFIRSIVIDKDSVIWGGYQDSLKLVPRKSFSDISLGSDDRDITFTFSTAVQPVFGSVEYRYRLDDSEKWSDWSEETSAEFVNLSSGSYHFEVQARDCFGRVSEVAAVKFSVAWPWYLRWWSILLYLAALAALVYEVVQLRTRRVMQEKERLEKLVEEKSSQLVRQEKMVTVGNLTKGLIDRILNPINYINNFSHLSEGLADDIIADIEDDKENITPDIYDDLTDVAQMIRSNLAKVVEHGTNTSRILKAMEEMLKERVGTMAETDIAEVCRQDMEMLGNYYKDDIAAMNIDTQITGCDEKVLIMADAATLSKSILSMLANSVYAVRKKYQKQAYQPVIRIAMEQAGQTVKIKVYDNGIGIEDGIKNEIFAPFFTTKTTSEAAGVGLYLTRETIQEHGGDITVESVKDEYTEFTITLKKL